MVGAANHALLGIATFIMSIYELPTHEEWEGVNDLMSTMKMAIDGQVLTRPA